ncbi:MAG: hypothetical protein EAZ42_11755, partial [Verrucomicrobia bacterium]
MSDEINAQAERQKTSGGDLRSPFLKASQTPTRKSRMLHNTRAAALPHPRMRLAPSLRRAGNRSRALANASFTNTLLPITAPS